MKWSSVKDSEGTSTRNRRKAGITGRLESNLRGNWRDILEKKFGKERMEEIDRREDDKMENAVYRKFCEQKSQEWREGEKDKGGKEEAQVCKELVYVVLSTLLSQ